MKVTLKGNLLELAFPYNIEIIEAVRNIPGRSWNAIDKVWTVPAQSGPHVYQLSQRLDRVEWEPENLRDRLANFSKSFEKSFDESRAIDADIDIPLPANHELYGYQKAGVKFALDRDRTLIGDEMGLGKTIQAVAYVNANPKIKNIVVVCTASIKINWRREIEDWSTRAPKVVIAMGSDFETYGPDDSETTWFVINYDILSRWKRNLSKIRIDLLVLDEAHYMKNADGKRARNVFGFVDNHHPDRTILPIKATKTIALTGSPIANRPSEIWTLAHNLAPEEFPNWRYFYYRYCDGKMNGARNLGELQAKLRSSIMIRRLKKDVLADLPPKIRQIIELPASADIRPVLDAELESFKRVQALEAAVESANKDNREEYEAAVEALNDGSRVFFSEMSKVRHRTGIAKIPQVIEHLEDVFESGVEKIVCFAWHTDVIAALKDHFPDAVSITGSDAMDKRQDAVDRFQKDPKCRLFIGNIRAAGVGITLTAASHVVFAELDWVPGNISQAEDRCHRIGQLDGVLVQHLVFEKSLDAKMAKRILAKQRVIDKALDNQAQVDPEIIQRPIITTKIVVEEKPVVDPAPTPQATPYLPSYVTAPEFVDQIVPETENKDYHDVRRYYAVPNESGALTFLRITSKMYFGRPTVTFVDQMIGGSDEPVSRARILADGRYIGTLKSLYEKVLENPTEAMAQFGKSIGRCGNCGKLLTDEPSRERGFGPVCYENLFPDAKLHDSLDAWLNGDDDKPKPEPEPDAKPSDDKLNASLNAWLNKGDPDAKFDDALESFGE